jgi:hypothetical protein
MATLAAQLDLVALFLAILAAILAPLSALLNHALAGRMGAFGRVCHRNLLGLTLRRAVWLGKRIQQ